MVHWERRRAAPPSAFSEPMLEEAFPGKPDAVPCMNCFHSMQSRGVKQQLPSCKTEDAHPLFHSHRVAMYHPDQVINIYWE
jgi:hypothetical protein